MYVDGAHILMRQCGREYGFATGDLCGKYAQATQLYLLSTEELVQLPKNNIPADHHLVAFGRKEPLLLTSQTKSSKQKPYVMTWNYIILHHFPILKKQKIFML